MDKSDTKNKADKTTQQSSQENVKQPSISGNCCILIFLSVANQKGYQSGQSDCERIIEFVFHPKLQYRSVVPI